MRASPSGEARIFLYPNLILSSITPLPQFGRGVGEHGSSSPVLTGGEGCAGPPVPHERRSSTAGHLLKANTYSASQFTTGMNASSATAQMSR